MDIDLDFFDKSSGKMPASASNLADLLTFDEVPRQSMVSEPVSKSVNGLELINFAADPKEDDWSEWIPGESIKTLQPEAVPEPKSEPNYEPEPTPDPAVESETVVKSVSEVPVDQPKEQLKKLVPVKPEYVKTELGETKKVKEGPSIQSSMKSKRGKNVVFDADDDEEATVEYGNPYQRLVRDNIFYAITPYCDISALSSLLTVSQLTKGAVVSDLVWGPICKSMGVQKRTQSDSLVTTVDASNILSIGYREGEAYTTFCRIYEVLKPVVNNIEQYASNPELGRETVERAHILCNLQKVTSVLPDLFPDQIHQCISSFIAKEVSRIIELLSAERQTGQTGEISPLFEACDVYQLHAPNSHIRERAIETMFADMLVELPVSEAFSFYDNVGGFRTRQVSQSKVEASFGQIASSLITLNLSLTHSHTPVPPSWCVESWTYLTTKLLAAVVIYSQGIVDETAREISEPEYLAAVPRIYLAFNVLMQNSVLNEIANSYEFELEPYLMNSVLRPFLDEFRERQTSYVDAFSKRKVREWNESISQREDEAEKYIWSNVPKKSDKSNFISSFKRVLSSSSNETAAASQSATSTHNNDGEAPPATEFEAQTAVLISKLRGMESLVSLELVIEIMDVCRTAICRLKTTNKLDCKVVEQIFCTFLTAIGCNHIQLAFEKALKVLNSYDPKRYGRLMITMNNKESSQTPVIPQDGFQIEDPEPLSDKTSAGSEAVEPLVVFTELVNVGDIVQQMVHVFFEEELVAPKLIRKSDFAASSVNGKRKFEQMLDDMLARGLSRGIDVLMDQVEFTLVTEQLGSDYLPLPTQEMAFGPTAAATKVINLTKSHLDLLKDTTEKSLFDVFQNEIGVRLYTALSKHIKSQIISVDGAVMLISDMNAYYKFIVSLRQRNLQPYYETLKQIAQLFLIDKKDAKQIGLAMSDSTRYNGLVTTEDLVEFVKRRRDWPLIKTKVEKTLYGIFECTIC